MSGTVNMPSLPGQTMNAEIPFAVSAPIVEGRGAGSPASPRPAGIRRSTVFWLLIVMGGSSLARLWIFNGIRGHDDWMYLFYVRSFLNGDAKETLESLWGLRWGIWLPIAILFKVFGVHYWLAFVPVFVLGLASIPIAYWITLRISGDICAARWATVVLAFNPVDWFVSTTIRGDIEMSFFGGLIVLGLVLLESSRKSSPSRAVWLAIATGTVWGLGALTKEWAFVYAWGFLALVLWQTFRERRVPWVYAYILLGFAAVMAVDGLFLYLTTGVFQQRYLVSIGLFDQGYQDMGLQGDSSRGYAYLPSLLLNLPTRCSTYGRFVNGYPLYGWYFYLFAGALAWGIWRIWRGRSACSLLLCFLVGTLLWVEFGSMSMRTYFPYHKEPRYLTILSVPIACYVGWALRSLWLWVQPWLRILLVGLLLVVAFTTGRIMHSEHLLYVEDRDFLPELVPWLKAHPETDLWITGSIQQDLDLRFGYRFADPVHKHRGQPGYGFIQDVGFLDRAKPGEFILITPVCKEVIGSKYTPEKWEKIAEFKGPHTPATLYRMTR